jgi:hypothetical protein
MNPNIGDTLVSSINRGFLAAAASIPNILTGVVILMIGVVLGSIVKRIIIELLRRLNVESYLRRYGVPEAKREFSWVNIVAEVIRWFVIILFLLPAADVWGLRQVTVLLNSFLLYLPNVFVGAIIAVVGFVVARLAHDVVLASTREISPEGSQTIASIAWWAIIIFVMLAVLTQLGVAQDLIKILFTGFVAMIAIAGGISFGLGGQETAKMLLESLRKGLHTTASKQNGGTKK